MGNLGVDLRDDLQIAFDKTIEGFAHRPFGRVLNRNDGVIGFSLFDGGEDIADRGIVPAFWAMWSANFLIGGVGLYLIYIVLTERPVFKYFRRTG